MVPSLARRRARATGAAAGLALALLLAACGDDPEPTPSVTPSASATQASPTPTVTTATPLPSSAPTVAQPVKDPTVAEVYRDTRTSALSAGSGHVTGTLVRDGKTYRIDVEGVANGANQTAFITIPDAGTAEVITVGPRFWLGGDLGFWTYQTGDAATAADMVGKYVQISESDATELGSFTLRTVLTEKFALPEIEALESDGSSAERTSLRGTDAWLLEGRNGAKLWVAADGSGALLRAVGPKGSSSDLSFTEWERAQTFRDPPADKITPND